MTKVTRQNDAFGMEMMAYLKGQDVDEFIERSDSYLDWSRGVTVYFSDFKDWSELEKKVILLAKGKCLDIGCGAGRVGRYLENKGISYLGIDNSPIAIDVCKKRNVKNVKCLPIEELYKIKDKDFKSVVMFGNNWGLFGTPKKAKKILKQLHLMTADDAIIITQSFDVSQTKNPYHLAYHKDRRSKGLSTNANLSIQPNSSRKLLTIIHR